MTARDTELEAYATAMTPAIRRAARAGLPLRTIVQLTGVSWGRVSTITRRFQPDPDVRTRWVDPLTERWIDFWGWRQETRSRLKSHLTGREDLLTLANGEQVTRQRLREIIEDIDKQRGGYQMFMLVGDRVAGMIGRDRMVLYDLSDGHFHHIGYDDPRNTSLEGFLKMLRNAGHQGVITFHPIPQRGMGLATLGGSFYYGIASVLTWLLFGQQMLQMWGKFPDVRLLDAVRALPPQLRWRAVAGVVGARMDKPGALGYLRLLAILNPDQAHLVGETTIMKEAVTDLLGDQAIHTVNPEWAKLVARLVHAVELLRQARAELPADLLAGLPADLRRLIVTEVHPAGVAAEVTAGLADLLVANIKPIAELLAAVGQHGGWEELHTARGELESGRLPMYNPHLRELLQASSEVGYLVVLHNDFGLARMTGNGRFADVTPDERYGAPLLALLADYGPLSKTRPVSDGHRPAKIVLAHLGVGKYTKLDVAHLDLINQVLSNPRYDHISFDISWNEVARQLLKVEEDGGTPIADKFIELVRAHPDRFIFGSDAVKPESFGQYVRQHHDLEPIFARIKHEVGPAALANMRHRTLETRLADAQRDVQQWVFNELSDPATRKQWDTVLDQLKPERRQNTLGWFQTQKRLGKQTTRPGVGPNYRLPDNTATPNGVRTMRWENNQQMLSLIRWREAVTPDVVAGRRLSLRLIYAAMGAARADHRSDRDDRRAARAARKKTKRSELDTATHTGGLGLRDANGQPYA
ncbi:MAG: hypothetical protein ACRDQ0_07570, partial [Pseudonocardia sp.]